MKFLLPPRIVIHFVIDFLINRYPIEKANDSMIPINENVIERKSLEKKSIIKNIKTIDKRMINIRKE